MTGPAEPPAATVLRIRPLVRRQRPPAITATASATTTATVPAVMAGYSALPPVRIPGLAGGIPA